MQERRLFFAIPLSEQTRTRIIRETSKWESLPLFVTRPEQLHISLLFLGFVKDGDIGRYSDAARDICSDTEPFELMFDAIVFTPDDDRPKLLSLLGEENESLRGLRNDFEAGLTEKTSEFLRFRPHVTLARLRQKPFASVLESRKASLPKPFRIIEPVSSVVLFESVGSGGRREYLPMEEFLLGQ